MKSYQIHLIRHAITAANENGQYIGTTNIQLSEQGKAQLINLKRTALYPQADVIYTSPLNRCVETCEILYPNERYIAVPGLSECDFGLWEGKTATELEENPTFKSWIRNATDTPPPNGEGTDKFTYRVCSTFEKIVESLLKTGITNAAIVTHAGVLTTILSAYGLPKASPIDWATEPGLGYSLKITPSLWMRDMVAEVYQRIPHFETEKKNGLE